MDNYSSVLSTLSKQWMHTQLTHRVSATAANSFWSIALHQIPKLLDAKGNQHITRKTPMFTQQRRKLYLQYCPDVKMKFAFKNKNTGVVQIVESSSTPSNQYQRNPDYIKIYEEAHVEVIIMDSITSATNQSANATAKRCTDLVRIQSASAPVNY